MWSNFVSIIDTFARHLAICLSEVVKGHPILIVSAGALGMGLVVTIWAETRLRHLGILQARVVDGGVPTWLRR